MSKTETPQAWDTVETREFYTLAEVGRILRMSKKHVYRRLIKFKLRDGSSVCTIARLRYHQDGPGAEILVRHRDLAEFVRRMAVEVDAELEGKKP